jgi:hypothetical protein
MEHNPKSVVSESSSRKVIPPYFSGGAFFVNPYGEILHVACTNPKDFQKMEITNLSQEFKLPKILSGSFPTSANPSIT